MKHISWMALVLCIAGRCRFGTTWTCSHPLVGTSPPVTWQGRRPALPAPRLVPSPWPLCQVHSSDAAPLLFQCTEFRRNFIHANGYGWLTCAPIMHPLPFRTLAATLPVLAAANLSLMPTICTTIYPEQQLEACVAGGVLKVVAWGVVLPLLGVYVAELYARQVFMATPVEAAATAAAAALQTEEPHR